MDNNGKVDVQFPTGYGNPVSRLFYLWNSWLSAHMAAYFNGKFPAKVGHAHAVSTRHSLFRPRRSGGKANDYHTLMCVGV